ncbi:tetratricopeptide repeat protein [Tenacibaculum sp. MAR_2009_124]|uniref:tetratricopeptide repeat protein n=1 Tax=Tenacibaculum sp. MAR_2009_124 TaxID=1250059 RepID=UPI000B89B4BA|nr:tetratricopeptide repeat protein [Tenacibaculum sp. MAR_2009_124]
MKQMKVVLLFFFVLYANVYGQKRKKINYNQKIEELKKELQEDEDEKILENRYYSIGYYFNKINQPDSAYKYISKSKDLCLELQDTLKTVQRMFSLARIESLKEFFTKSDSTAIQALRLLGTNKNKYKITVSLYNTLGINANSTGHYQEAVRCYNKVLEIASDSISIIGYKSNIAFNFIYLEKYVKANSIYNNIKSSQYFDSISDYIKAKVLDNHAYSKLLDKDGVQESDFLEGQSIKRQIGDINGLIDRIPRGSASGVA